MKRWAACVICLSNEVSSPNDRRREKERGGEPSTATTCDQHQPLPYHGSDLYAGKGLYHCPVFPSLPNAFLSTSSGRAIELRSILWL